MKSKKSLIITVVGCLLLAILAATSFFTVDQTQYVIITRFGRPVRALLEPGGPHLKAPFDKINIIDRRIFSQKTKLQQLVTGDKIPFIAQAYILWRVRDTDADVHKFFLALRGNRDFAEYRLNQLLSSIARAVFSEKTQDNLISLDKDKVQMESMLAEIKKQLNAKTQDPINGYGIEILDIGLSRLGLPDANTKKVYQTMKSEREMLSAKYRAEGRAEATKIRASANTYRSKQVEEAKRRAKEIVGAAEAKAVAIYGTAYRRDPDFYQYTRTLEAYEKIFRTKTNLVLRSDSALLKYLNPKFIDVTPSTPSSLNGEMNKTIQEK